MLSHKHAGGYIKHNAHVPARKFLRHPSEYMKTLPKY